jgi:serine/threonine-protein kinase
MVTPCQEEFAMAATVRLTVLTGPHQGSRFCLRGMTACMVGRAAECQVRLAGTPRDQCISRCHCQLAFDPPLVRVQDMDSANGTYINGHKVGVDLADELLQSNAMLGVAKDGDIITLGGTSLRVNIMDCPEYEPDGPAPLWKEAETVKQDCPVDC